MTKDDRTVSESGLKSTGAAKTLSALGAAKGGRARASILSKEERQAIGRKAIAARWAKAKGISPEQQEQQVSESVDHYKTIVLQEQPKLPVALFPGTLSIGEGKYLCYVLDTGKRVISQR